jgi:D-alanyl-D-alanine carboxypeptidase
MRMPFAGGTFAFLAFVILAWTAPAAAVPSDFEARANAYLDSAYPADGPGAAVIVTQGGRTVYARGRGMADLATGTPIGPETVFRLGSITKQFTAAVILQLADEGRLSLDDPLSRFLPDYPAPGAGATVRQLLNHTVGVQPYTGIPGWMVEANTNRAYTTDEMIAVFRDLPALAPPGQAWMYNNSGYVLLGAIIERVTGMAWHEAIEQRIARPLDLATIRYGVGEEDVPHMARGYTQGARPAMRIHMSVPHAAGALIGDVNDLAAWAHALHHGRVIGPESYAGMIAPTEMPGGQTIPYGFGMGRGDLRGRPSIGHSGGIFGFSTDSIYLPDADLFVAVLANSDAPATPSAVVLRRLAALALDDPYPTFERVQADPAAIAPLLGVYALADGTERTFFARDGRLYTRRGDAPETEAFAAGGDRFFYGPASLTWFRIARDADGAHVMEMHQNGAMQAERSTRRGPVPAEAAPVAIARETLARYAGDYAFGQTGVAVTLSEDGTLMVQLTGQPRLDLAPVSDTEFRIQRANARIVFHEEGGRVTHLVIHQAGREVRADRVEPAS